MRDFHVTSRRDMACRRNDPSQCACIHAEELTPVSWSECVAIVHRNKHTYASYNSYAHNTQLQESKFVRYLGGDKIEEYYQSCVKQTNQACRPSRFLFPETTASETGLSLLMGTIGNISVADAIAKFYSADNDAAGHAAIKAVCAARGAGTTCGGLTGITGLSGLTGLTFVGQTNLERAMLVPFGPITRDGAWIDPVTLFSV
jgi:hypothetical protein